MRPKEDSRRCKRFPRTRDPILEKQASRLHRVSHRSLMPRWRNRVFCFSAEKPDVFFVVVVVIVVVVVVVLLFILAASRRSGAVTSNRPVAYHREERYDYSLSNNLTTEASVYRCAPCLPSRTPPRAHVCVGVTRTHGPKKK